MSEKQNNAHYYEDEIDLRELIKAIWKRKRMIISVTLILATIAALFSSFILSPVFDTKMNIIISMPETYNTKYGEYTLPITSNDQYISLITSNEVLVNTIKDMGYNSKEVNVENLLERISISNYEVKPGSIQNSFYVTVSADNPEESLKLAETLYDNYIEFVDVMSKERAVSYYYDHFNTQLKALGSSLDSAKEILKKNEELLSQTPRLIGSADANLEIQTQLTSTSNYVVPVDTVNPNYIKIENDIVESKQTINNIEDGIRMNKQYIEELKTEKQAIDKYYQTGRIEKLESGIIGVAETSIYLPSPPVAPKDKTSPSIALYTITGAIVGGMIAVMIALFKQYWNKEL